MPGLPDTESAPGLPSGNRFALVIATTAYIDTRLSRLRAPAQDAKNLAEVLGDPDIGAFSVTAVLDQSGQTIRTAMEDFLSDRGTQDLLLVYLSCHGLLDPHRRLFFAATDTRKDRLQSTGVEAAWILDLLEHCRARRQVLILDSCFSGAFARGAKGDADVRLQDHFGGQGRGRVVLTASTATEYSFEGESAEDGAATPSVFTAALVEGLQTGNADLDHDGYISIDDAYAYAFDRVRSAGIAQTPQRWLYGAEGMILLARSKAGHNPLPESLRDALDNPIAAIRIAAVNELAAWTASGDLTRQVTALHYLRQVAESDIQQVADAARTVLDFGAEGSPTAGRIGAGRDFTAPDSAKLSVHKISSPTPVRHDPGGPWQLSVTVTRTEAEEIGAIAFSPDGLVLAYACKLENSQYGAIALLDPVAGRQLRSMGGMQQCKSINFSPDGRTLVTDHEGATHLWDLATGGLVRSFDGSYGVAATTAFSSNGEQLIICARETLKIVDPASGKLRRSFKIAPPGGTFARARRRMPGQYFYVSATALSRDGSLVATGYSDGSVQILDIATGDIKRVFKYEGDDGDQTGRGYRSDPVELIEFSPDGTELVIISGPGTCLLNLDAGGQGRALEGSTSFLVATYSPHDRLIATGEFGGQVKLWNSSSGRHMYSFPGNPEKDSRRKMPVKGIAFSPDGNRLAVAKKYYTISPSVLERYPHHGTDPDAALPAEPGAWLEIWY